MIIPYLNTRSKHTSLIYQNPRQPYVPGVREPYHLPDDVFQIPEPKAAPLEPAPFNFLTLLTPFLTAGVSLALRYTVMSGGEDSDLILILMISAAVIHPVTNLINFLVKKKKYLKAIKNRQADYGDKLGVIRENLERTAAEQRQILHDAYPDQADLLRIAGARGRESRLWYRRLGVDSDFLSLRAGTYPGPASFFIEWPSTSFDKDPLAPQAADLMESFTSITNLPFLIPLSKVGSLGVVSRDEDLLYGFTRRLVSDAIVHHSPTDLKVFLLTDQTSSAQHWDWLKWPPHTGALLPDNPINQLAFQKADVISLSRWLAEEQKVRKAEDPSALNQQSIYPKFMIIIDDRGQIRQMPDLSDIIRSGHETGICTLFLGEENLPQIRARLDLGAENQFRYAETWEGGDKFEGDCETVDLDSALETSRSIACLETLGGKVEIPLPKSLALSDSIDNLSFRLGAIEENWSADLVDEQRLLFPIGVNVTPDGLATLMINLLPAERGGYDSYHAILIGTTGSGKSEFMKSLVLGAAYQYSPEELNFFFLDFKGGAAFDPFKALPHVSGVVTNLQPQLVDRGLMAVQSEIDRRQELFAREGVRDIWAFNQNCKEKKLPHLWLMLDEFAKGLSDFPELRKMLDLLVRQGRSLGMYLLLANQDVNSAVDNLLSNVGWRIALKVALKDELKKLLEEPRKPTVNPGHGYLRTTSGEILEFQSGYAGSPISSPDDRQAAGFEINLIGPDGKPGDDPVFSYQPLKDQQSNQPEPAASEQDTLISLIKQATSSLGLESASPIYLDPLPESIPLFNTLENTKVFRKFQDKIWTEIIDQGSHLTPAVGMVDYSSEGIQIPLKVNFREKDGHLWMFGAPGSGKEQSLISILMSLAAAHTPEEIHFYILECGSGLLMSLENLPHTGAVIRLSEKERFERLLDFLDREMDRRQVANLDPSASSDLPSIFLIVNNFGELRSDNYDEIDRIAGYIQGSKVGIHLILVSNLMRELSSQISNNISRRIILQLVNQDEMEVVVGRKVPPLSAASPGRGYWMDDETLECQLAQPVFTSHQAETRSWQEIAEEMKNSWTGPQPPPVEILPEIIPFAELVLDDHSQELDTKMVPVGFSYQSQELVQADIEKDAGEWVILGDTKSGRSNYLICLAEFLSGLENWEINLVALRPSPVRNLSSNPQVAVHTSLADAIQALSSIDQLMDESPILPTKQFIGIDNAGSLFDPGNEELERILDSIGKRRLTSPEKHSLIVLAADLMDIRSKVSMNSVIKAINQAKTGICFSQEMENWSWLGVSFDDVRPYQKMRLPPGRGYFINRGKPIIVQTLFMDQYHK